MKLSLNLISRKFLNFYVTEFFLWWWFQLVQMPKRNAPEEPLIFGIHPKTVKKIPYPDHYDLQWQTPLDNGEPIEYYQIIYYQVPTHKYFFG